MKRKVVVAENVEIIKKKKRKKVAPATEALPIAADSSGPRLEPNKEFIGRFLASRERSNARTIVDDVSGPTGGGRLSNKVTQIKSSQLTSAQPCYIRR